MDRRAFVKSALATGATMIAGGRDRPGIAAQKENRQAADSTSDETQPGGALEQAAQILSEHRIAKIEARRLRDRYPRQVGRNAKGGGGGRGGSYQIRLLTTDQGARGWGMSYIADEKVQHLVGALVSDLFDSNYGTTPQAEYIKMPVWDLAGHILDKPVYALLGSAGPNRLPIYSGAIYFDDLEPRDKPRGVEGVLASCRQDYEAGYRAFKLKIGRGFKCMPRNEGIKRDIEVTRAVGRQFPDCKVLVDANDGYTCDDFLGYVSAVADCDLFWIEEPFRENRDHLLRLHEHISKVGCKALIAEGEGRTERAKSPWRYGDYSRRHIDTLFALAKEKLVDVFLLDLGIVGFTRWRHIMPELKAAGVLASPHTWAWTPRPYYAAQLAAGVGNVVVVEGIPGKAAGVDYSAYKLIDGKLVMPDTPGFGLTLEG